MKNKLFISKIKSFKVPAKIVFILTGIASTLWFLFRVIPKPSRATYPCMKATVPFMSAFVLYIISLTGSVLAFRKSGKKIIHGKYMMAMIFFLIGGLAIIVALNIDVKPSLALSTASLTPNNPIGTPTGYFPGRVVWVWDPDATNENMTNTAGDYWYQNTDAAVVQDMLDSALMKLTLQTTVADAWDALFKYFNNKKGRGETGYTSGEKIMIKINLTNSYYISGGTAHTDDNAKAHMDQTPEVMLAVLQHLIDEVGVAQPDITIGDPYRTFRDEYWDVCHTAYPDVNYCDGEGLNGRVATVQSGEAVVKFSESEEGYPDATLPQSYLDADYFINMSCLKTHNEGGITLCAKNHQGSINVAPEMHPCLPANDTILHHYRHLVDFMGHEYMGGNTVLYIVDGIWAGFNWEGIVEKWGMSPFNNDYPNSLFVSQDPVAIESVCYDFLEEEYSSKPSSEQYPMIDGAIDYLMQAADPSNWPSDIDYDPEGDGSILGSLGVHEHWNNATEKQYTTNLNGSGGIHLVSVPDDLVVTEVQPIAVREIKQKELMLHVSPNPAVEYINVSFGLKDKAMVTIEIFTMEGKRVKSSSSDMNAGEQSLEMLLNDIQDGMYLVRISVDDGKNIIMSTEKIEKVQ